ncbi:MAG: hypothetical protein JST26_16785 [Bacteroidetes bacterium]|nr:hypothetical protein [Bacteroidota bacterium]
MKKKLLLIFMCLSGFFKMYAQVTGPQPSFIKWKYIENDAVKVIFPDTACVDEAIRIANLTNFIRDHKTISVGSKSKKLPILLNTYNVESNGYVALTPYRCEFYGTGFQNFNFLGSLNWLDALSIHEYRHSLQFNNARRGFTRVASVLFGQKGWQLAAFVIPNWYLEGDAVMTETLLSSAGRGRSSDFTKEQRALWVAGKNYTYLQNRNGSYTKILPNQYPLGYAMINYGRNHYGPDIWQKVLADAGRYRTVFYSFSGALRKHAGVSTKQLYKLTRTEMYDNWEKELQTLELTPTTAITKIPKKTVTHYTYPSFYKDSSIICQKVSFKQIPTLVQIKHGKEKQLAFIPSGVLEPYISLNGDHVVWCEYRKNGRRDAYGYSVIVSYNLLTGKRKQLTPKKSKYFAPMLSSAGDKIVAVNANEFLKNSVKIIDAKTGAVTFSIPNPHNDFVSMPKWTKDDGAIVFLAKRNSKIALLKYDLTTGATTELIPWTSQIIGAFCVAKNNVYFDASFSGINNIYSVGLSGDKQIKQITTVKVCAEMPNVTEDENNLVMAEYTYMGWQLSQVRLNDDTVAAHIKTIQVVEPMEMERYHVKTTDIEHSIIDSVPAGNYTVKNYNGFFRGVKLHSWFLLPTPKDISLNLNLDNILADFSIKAKASHNFNEKANGLSFNFDYARYFLPIGLKANIDQRSNKTYLAGDTTVGTRTFNQAELGAGLSLPLNWLKNNYRTSVLLSGFLSNIETSNYKLGSDKELNKNYNFNSMDIGFSFSHLRNKAYQNLNHKWSQTLAFQYQKGLGKVSAERITASMDLTAIGFMKNHAFGASFRYKQENTANNYLYLDNFIHARGYSASPSDIETVIAINYGLPLLNVDRGWAGLFFVNRIRANMFCDIGTVQRKSLNKTYSQNSYGFELVFDTKILNAIGPLGLGIRYAVLQNKDLSTHKQQPKVEFMFSAPL